MTSYTFSQIEPLLNGLLAAVLTIKINFFEVHLCFENQYCQYNVYYLNIISDFNFWQEIILIFHLRGALQNDESLRINDSSSGRAGEWVRARVRRRVPLSQ